MSITMTKSRDIPRSPLDGFGYYSQADAAASAPPADVASGAASAASAAEESPISLAAKAPEAMQYAAIPFFAYLAFSGRLPGWARIVSGIFAIRALGALKAG